MTDKVDVNGPDAHPVFRQLTEAPDAAGEAGPVQWNFEKWLVAPDGTVVARFRPERAARRPRGAHRGRGRPPRLSVRA